MFGDPRDDATSAISSSLQSIGSTELIRNFSRDRPLQNGANQIDQSSLVARFASRSLTES
jgi:hypothetical protein